MNNYLASFVPALANHLWQSTAFAATVWVLTILLRKNSARVRYGIWLAASIKFLTPFSLLIAVGGLLPKPKQLVAPAVYTAIKVTEQPFADISPTPTASAAVTLTQRIAADISAVLLALWLAGVAVILIIWFVRWRKASICLHDAVPAAHGRELEILRGLEVRLSSRLRAPLGLRLSPDQTEPSVYGILRPVLVWPQRLSEQLSDEHIEAIMTHELAHAQRFDNATAALHMLVEAVFWFHPLVWWMERRMIEERERACDEAVVGFGASADAYAEGILKTCRFCVESALPCVAGVTGSDLKRRVVDIMTAGRLMQMTWPKKMLVGAAVLCLVAAPTLLGQLDTSADWEKAAGGKMSFDVASVREDTAGLPPSGPAPHSNVPLFAGTVFPKNGNGTRLSITNLQLQDFIAFAYKMDANEAKALWSQLPKWAQTERFDIEARAPEGTTKDQMRLMMQSLLADRFKLAVHYETQQERVYSVAFVKPGKIGPSLRLYGADEPPCGIKATPDATPTSTVPGGFPVPCGGIQQLVPSSPEMVRFGARNITMAMFASTFSGGWTAIDRPVVDKTGINGNVDFVLEFYPLSDDSPDVLPGPTFLEAIKDQLGLKLNEDTAPIRRPVIDHVEEPSAN
jgi:bla regulator protein blaR1